MKCDFLKRYAANRRKNCVGCLSLKMISNKNSLNYRVVDLDEIYTF
jgi:hypothetical protein